MQMTSMLRISTGVVAASLVLAACGGGSSAPVESASGSGEPAFFGTKGVEATIINDTAPPTSSGKWDMTVKDRNSGQTVTLPIKGSRTFRGETNISDDLELLVGGTNVPSDMEVELDFSNPTAGCPNVTVALRSGGDNEGLCSEGDQENFVFKFYGQQWDITVKRESDSSDFKRFTVSMKWSRSW